MADWTNIANTALQPGAPVRSIDGVALRDNPIAIAEGAAGAPRIAGQTGPAVQTNGIFDGAVTNAKIANSAVSRLKHLIPVAGTSVYHAKINPFFQTQSNQFQNISGQGRFFLNGIYSVTAELRTPNSGDAAVLRVFKNGSLVFDLSTSSNEYVTVSGNISCGPSDWLSFQFRCANKNNDRLAQLSNLRITSGNDSIGGYSV